jgi:hypothetical protein
VSAIVSQSPSQRIRKSQIAAHASLSQIHLSKNNIHTNKTAKPAQNTRPNPAKSSGDAKASRQPRWPPADEPGYTDHAPTRQPPEAGKTHMSQFGSLPDAATGARPCRGRAPTRPGILPRSRDLDTCSPWRCARFSGGGDGPNPEGGQATEAHPISVSSPGCAALHSFSRKPLIPWASQK